MFIDWNERKIIFFPNSQPRFILIGNKELCIRTNLGNKIQETKFKVTRMRCWRVTTNYNVSLSKIVSISIDFIETKPKIHLQNDSDPNSTNTQVHSMELSFEYLMSKSCLKWITIASEQAMLMFVCLQNMVDELLNKKDGNDFNNIQVRIIMTLY